MKEITLTKRKIDVDAYRKRGAAEGEIALLIREPTIITDAETGMVVAIYGMLPPEATELRNALKAVKFVPNMRTGGLKTTSRIFGAMPRIAIRSDFCRQASLSRDAPSVTTMLQKWGTWCEDFYELYAKDRYNTHRELVGKVLPEFRLGDSVFTSGIVNKNNPLKYHFDSGNFPHVFSCMLGFKENMLGGYLNFPEYDCALEIKDLSISMFDGQSILHGVTPMQKLSTDATRFTCVFYSLKGMWKCEPLGAELERIRRVKTERERKRLTPKT